MISFLNSIILPGLVAVTIPLLIHLFTLKRAKKIPFSSLRFLKSIEQKRIKRVRLFQILLILIRSLLIFMLIMAFARPTLQSSLWHNPSDARKTVVIVADDSFSMQASESALSQYEIGIEHIKKIMATMKEEDQIFFIPASEANRDVKPVNISFISKNLLKLFKPTYYSSGINDAVQRSKQIFNQYPNVTQELYIISDFRFDHTVEMDSALKYLYANNTKTFLLPTDTDGMLKNVSIDTVVVLNQIIEKQRPVSIEVQLKSHGKDEAAPMVSLFNDNERVAMQSISLGPSMEESITFNFIPEKEGFHFLKVELSADELNVDNYYYLTLFLPNAINILFITSHANGYLQDAMITLNDGTMLEIARSDFTTGTQLILSDYNLIVLHDPPQDLNRLFVKRLQDFLVQGQNVLTIPGQNLDPESIGKFVFPESGNNFYGSLRQTNNKDVFYSLTPNFLDKSLFGNLFYAREQQPSLPKIYKYYRIERKDESLIQFNNQDDFLSSIKVPPAGGKLFLLSCDLNLEWTDLPLHGLFVPLLHRILLLAGQNTQLDREFLIDEKVSIQISGINPKQDYILQLPASDERQITPLVNENGLLLDLGKLNDPGFYTIKEDQNPVEAFSVNVSPGELDGPYLDLEDTGDGIIVLANPGIISEQITESRQGIELWYYAILLALILLLLEIIIAKRIEGKSFSAK